MPDFVRIEIEVTPRAAEILENEPRRRSVGALISTLLEGAEPERDPLRALFAEIKKDARSVALTDEQIDKELAEYNAERRL